MKVAVALWALVSCKTADPPVARTVSEPVAPPAPASMASAEPPPAPPAVVSVPRPCVTPLPVAVTTENLTKTRGDLCAAVNRSIGSLPRATGLGAGGFELGVKLTRLAGEQAAIACTISIALSSRSVALGSATGGAKASVGAGTDRTAATRDCVDAVISDLLGKKLVPLMQRHLAQSATPAAAGSATQPSPLAPSP